MIWKIKPSPCIGEVRIRRRFALLPVNVGNYWVWLQWFFVQEEFDDVFPHLNSGWSEKRRWLWGAGHP